MHVIPTTWETEAGESLEPGGCSELRSCYYTPAQVTEQDSVSKKGKNKTKLNIITKDCKKGYYKGESGMANEKL